MNYEEQVWLEHYDAGVPEHVEYPQTPLYAFLDNAVSKYMVRL